MRTLYEITSPFPHYFFTIILNKADCSIMISYKLAFLTLFAAQTFALDLLPSVPTTAEGFENEEKVADASNNTSTKVCCTIYFRTKGKQ